MVDGDTTLFESGAMVQHIMNKYSNESTLQLEPTPGTREHGIYLQWSQFAEATYARPCGEIVNHRREFNPEIPAVVEEMQSRVHLSLAAVEDALIASSQQRVNPGQCTSR